MCERRVRSERATWLGRYPSRRIASCTVPRVSSATSRLPDRTWDTVVGLTPARAATWLMVTRVSSGAGTATSADPVPFGVVVLFAAIPPPFCLQPLRRRWPPARRELSGNPDGLRQHVFDRVEGRSYRSEDEAANRFVMAG